LGKKRSIRPTGTEGKSSQAQNGTGKKARCRSISTKGREKVPSGRGRRRFGKKARGKERGDGEYKTAFQIGLVKKRAPNEREGAWCQAGERITARGRSKSILSSALIGAGGPVRRG